MRWGRKRKNGSRRGEERGRHKEEETVMSM